MVTCQVNRPAKFNVKGCCTRLSACDTFDEQINNMNLNLISQAMNTNFNPTKLLCGILILLSFPLSTTLKAQVKIGDNPTVINTNSILELESTSKGFLPPRVSLNSATSISPLTGTVPAGMTVYSIGGTLTDGYYVWNGSKWIRLSTNDYTSTVVTKTASCTLLKTETMVLASNDITLTLPTVTSADNGLEITVKNVGTHTDLVIVKGNGSSIIDNSDDIDLCRWVSQTFIAYNGNWNLKYHQNRLDNVFNIDSNGSWTSVKEVIEFLNLHMEEPSVVQFCGGSYTVSETQVINLPYPVTFEGTSFGETSIDATSGVSGSPMFICQTECYFKMLVFTAYANTSGNDAIRFTGGSKYHEVKDCTFSGFNKGIVTTNNTDLWIFENDFEDCTGAAIEIAAGSACGGRLRISECDFMQCAKGIHLSSGVSEIISVISCTFYNTSLGTDIGILYVPATFTSFTSIFITHNAWNNQGTYVSGFDFSRSDGRDANAFLINNAGMENQNPHCKINVSNNAATTTVTTAGTYYKANWTNAASSSTCKWTMVNNKITYQPNNGEGVWAIITGNIAVNYAHTITIGIVKNGVSGTRFGETDLRITTANVPFQFSTVIYLPNIVKNDYLELWVTSVSSGDVVTFQDVQWFTNTQ
jgi:hypothetical protein